MDIGEEILKPFQEVRAADITHDELGIANGFHESQAAKSKACDYIQRIMDLVTDYGHQLEEGYLNDYLTKVKNHTEGVLKKAGAINGLVEGSINQENYPQQRATLQKQMIQTVASLQIALYPFESALRLVRLEAQLTAEDALTSIQQAASEKLDSIQAANTEVDGVLQSLRDKLSQYVTDEAARNFSALAGDHKDREAKWFVGLVCASAATVAAISWAFWTLEPSAQFGLVLGAFLKRALIISAPAVFMRVCLTKYNLERNLRIIYNHRDTVLEQYRVFESSISDDEAKNQFRLELARVIFDDPETGYTRLSASSEVNINPIVGAFEKIAGRPS